MSVLGQIRTLVELFLNVALADPLSLALVVVGGTLVGASSAVFGYLSARGVVAWLAGRSTAGPPTQAE